MTDLYQASKAWRVAGMLFLFMVINFMDKIAVGLLAVPMMAELGLKPAQFGLLASSFFWLFALAGVAGGFLADRRPTTGLLLGMAALWAACQLPMALSSSLAGLVIARVLLGLGEGPAMPVAMHACYKWFPDHKRNMPAALLSIGSAVGLLLSALAAPAISAHWGWRTNFYLLALLGAAWALAWRWIGAEGPIGAVTAEATKAAVARLPLRRLLADRTVVGSITMRFVSYWGLALSLTWVPAYLQAGLGFDAVTAGRLYALIIAVTIPFTLLMPLCSQRLLARGVSSRVGRGLLSAATLIVSGAAFLAQLTEGLSPGLRVAMLALASGLAPVIYTLGPAMIAEVVPATQRGSILAIDTSISSLAGVLAPVVTGLLVQAVGGERGYELGFALCGALMLIGAIAGALLARPDGAAARLAMTASA